MYDQVGVFIVKIKSRVSYNVTALDTLGKLGQEYGHMTHFGLGFILLKFQKVKHLNYYKNMCTLFPNKI